jgi:3,4-dihydroxy 2-butanone 4-phosphate synthase/GTP cyclohydrolase II
MARIAAEGTGVLVVLAEPVAPDELLARITGNGQAAAAPRVTEWRRTGAGAQILADLGLRRLRVLGTPRRQVGLAGFGLEVVEYVAPDAST